MTPSNIEVRPAKRSCGSLSCPSATSMRRSPAGLANGNSPSTISNNAMATLSSCHMATASAGRLLHVLEEVQARVQHHDIVFLLEALLVGAQTAVKQVELRRLRGRIGNDRGGARVAFAV